MKTLHLSIIAISIILILPLSQTAFGLLLYPDNDRLEEFANSTRMTKLVHDGAVLMTSQTIKKLEYKIGERITVHPELINIGNKSMNIFYLLVPFFVVICDQNGTIVWLNGPSHPVLEYSYNSNQTLKPNIPFIPETPYLDDPRYPLTLDAPGNYTLYSVADFYDETAGPHRNLVWSQPVQITVLPEKYTIADMNKLPPLQQFLLGVPAANVKCYHGLHLLIKIRTGLPVCVKSSATTKLIERGWAKESNPVATVELSPQLTHVIIPQGFDDPSSGKTFDPASVKVVIGVNNTVHWINNAGTTTITSNGFKESNLAGEIFGGSTIMPGNTYEFTFTKAGTYGYHGEPQAWQKGKVTVLEP